MSKYSQGNFEPENPKKYVGTFPITYRSSWELSVFRVFDKHPSVLQWASESIAIPYFNPVTNKGALYYPDLMVVYQNANGVKHAEVVEIKPASQTYLENAKSKKDKLELAVNKAKWQAAVDWCNKNGFKFRIMTEMDLFRQPKKRTKK